MTPNHEHFMEKALEEAKKGEAEGNTPVGSVIVWGGEVVARGRNLVNSKLDPTAHAETVAIRNAGPAVGAVEFPGATLYTTFEPCPMCLDAIMAARVSTLVLGGRFSPVDGTYEAYSTYGAYSVERLLELTQWSSRLELVTGVLQERCEALFYDWRSRNTPGT